MKSVRVSTFDERYKNLDRHIRRDATKAYRFFCKEPSKVKFKQIKTFDRIRYSDVLQHVQLYSARVNAGYRVLGLVYHDSEDQHCVDWFWIGSHSEYENMISSRGLKAIERSLKATYGTR